MFHRIKQVLLRSTMGIMAGNTRSRTGLDPVMGIDKACLILVVTFSTEFRDRLLGQRRVIGTVCIVTSGTVLRGGRMQRAVTPELGDLAMTVETKSRHAFGQITGMRRSVAVMTGHALHLGHRIMLDFVLADFGFNIRVAVEADLSRLPGDEISLIGAMGAMTHTAVTFGKWRVSGLFRSFADQVLVAGHAEFSFVGGLFEKTGLVAPMG